MKTSDVRVCSICGDTKPLDDFYRRPLSPDGLRRDCKECVKTRVRASVEGRIHEVAAYQREYRKLNHDRLAAANRERTFDPERRRDRIRYARRYRHENYDAALAREARYRRKNRHKETLRRHARRAVPVSPDALAVIVTLQRDPCPYCGQLGGTIDHIVAVTQGGVTEPDNLAAACLSCNSRKRTRPVLIFLAEAHV